MTHQICYHYSLKLTICTCSLLTFSMFYHFVLKNAPQSLLKKKLKLYQSCMYCSVDVDADMTEVSRPLKLYFIIVSFVFFCFPAFCEGATLALYQIDLVQQLRPDVTTVEVGWSRWCLVGSTGGFLLGALLNTCDSVKRNRLHRQEVQKKAEVKGKMMAEMEARRRQAAAAALRGQPGEGARRGVNGSGGGGSGGGGGSRGFKMTAQVAARAAAASIVGARERGDFRGKRMSLAVDAAVTNALAQLNLHKSLAAGSPNHTTSNPNAKNNTTATIKPRENSTSNNRNADGVILVNEARANREPHPIASSSRQAENKPKSRAAPSKHQTNPKDTLPIERNSQAIGTAITTTLPQSSTTTTTTTTTTTSLQSTTPSTSSTLPSIENLRKSKLTKSGHVDSGQDLNRLARLPVVREEHGDHSATALDDKSRARLEEAEALRRRVSDTKGFSTDHGLSRAHTTISSSKRDDFRVEKNGENTTSSLIPVDKISDGKLTSSSITEPTRAFSDLSSKYSVNKREHRNDSSKDSTERTGVIVTTSSSDYQRESKNPENIDQILSKPEDLHSPPSRDRRKSALGDALLGVSNFINDTVSIGADKSSTHVRLEKMEDEQLRSKYNKNDSSSETSRTKSMHKSPSVIRKTRDSIESFSQEMGIDPLPPVTSSNRNQAPDRDKKDRTENSYRPASSKQKDPVKQSPLKTKPQSVQVDKVRDNVQVEDCSKITGDDSHGRLETSTSSRSCDEGKRIILPRLTSVESTTKPTSPRDNEAASVTARDKPSGKVVKVEEMASPREAKVKADGSDVKGGETTKARVPTKSETLPAQMSEEERKRRKVVESMVRVSRETRKKRITQ